MLIDVGLFLPKSLGEQDPDQGESKDTDDASDPWEGTSAGVGICLGGGLGSGCAGGGR